MLTRSVIFATLTATTVWLCKTSPEIKAGGEPGVVMRLPEHVGHFTGEKMKPDAAELSILPKDTEFAKMVYHTTAADAAQRDFVNISVVLSGAERRSIHRPEVCMQSQGWSILSSRVLPVELEDGRTLQVRDLYMTKPVAMADGAQPRQLRVHFVYWFVGTNVSTPDHLERTLITLRDNIFSGINHRWAYASATCLVTEGLSPEEAGQRIRNDEETVALVRDLIRNLTPKFQKEYMPPQVAMRRP